MMTPGEAGRLMYESRRRGRHRPPELADMPSMDDGYRVQLEVLALELAAGEEHAGWKVGLTAKAIQQQLGVHERVFGYLLHSGECRSPLHLEREGLMEPFFENELCVIVGSTLRGPGVTREAARAAIAAVAPAVELVEKRGPGMEDLPLILADNAEQKAFITGPFTDPLPPEAELQHIGVEICVNGVSREQARGDAVLEGPEGSLAWLANRLADFGHAVEAGCKVITGSYTRQFPVVPGERYEHRVSPFGTVTVHIR